MSFRETAKVIEFYKQAFNATETMRHVDGAGIVRHAEIQIAGSTLMLHDENPDFPDMKGVQTFGGSPINLFVFVEDVDGTYHQAVAAGAKALGPLEDKEYGRSAGVVDPFGLTWWLCSAPK
jgi:PhnB protein